MAEEKVKDDDFIDKRWKTFLKKLREIDNPELKISKWKYYHALSYMCKRYKEYFGRDYVFSMNVAPTKSKDVFFIKKIIAMLNTQNMYTVKEYIDWVFDEKVIPKKIKIRTFGFFMSSDFINEFYFYLNDKNKITRAKILPQEYKCIATSIGVNVNTYGELAFIYAALQKNSEDPSREPYKKLFFHLQSLGFDENVLKGI